MTFPVKMLTVDCWEMKDYGRLTTAFYQAISRFKFDISLFSLPLTL